MDRALQVRKILSTRGLTLNAVSRQSAQVFGRLSKFCVPHNLYGKLKPTIHQILALSHLTNYRLSDWLKVLGIHLDTVSRLQLRIPRRRTTLLDSTVYDTSTWIPWFTERTPERSATSIAPLGSFLQTAPAARAADLLAVSKRRFRYALIGQQDAYALPYFLPGSIIRADPRQAQGWPTGDRNRGQAPFFLVEYPSGLTCSRITFLDEERFLLHCPDQPCLERVFRVEKDAQVLGMVDAEVRPLLFHRTAQPVSRPARVCDLRAADPRAHPTSGKDLLRRSRVRAGFTFREASSISRFIAKTLGQELYFAAASTLSDYEVLSAPPRHIEKAITLCLVYGIGFYDLLRAFGLPLEKAGREPMPDELFLEQPRTGNDGSRVAEGVPIGESRGLLGTLLNQWEEVPLFLRSSLDEITGLKGFSLSDVFWLGGSETKLHPLLVNAPLVAVNRKARKPSPSVEGVVCNESLYVILKRDGGYLCGRCTLDPGKLVVHGYPGGPVDTLEFRDGIDAEVVGQVTAILRRLP